MKRLIAVVLSILAWHSQVLIEAQPAITQQPTNQTVLPGANATFAVSVSGTGPFTYQWRLNGTNLPYGIITTVAGNRTMSFSGDGGAATHAGLFFPKGVALDSKGNLFIADCNNNRIRKVNNIGIITTVAGNGTPSFSGDGGPATNAALYGPDCVIVDDSGNLFITDEGNERIRKVATNGIITTVAGNGTASFSGDGGAATNAALYFWGGMAYIALDANGNLFIADRGNNRIRKVNSLGIITTVAGNGAQSFSGDGGAAINASFSDCAGVAVDVAGNLFIADWANFRIRKVNSFGIISTVAGNGTQSFSGDGVAAINAGLLGPQNVAVDGSGNLFITQDGSRIRKVAANGIITTVAGNGTQSFFGDGGAATNAGLSDPMYATIDNSGNLFIADTGNDLIRKVDYSSRLPQLTVNAASANHAGNYTVIVTGAGGSVTSSVATLTITSYNRVTGQNMGGGNMRLSFVGDSSGNYALDRSFSLAPPNWVSLVTNPADAYGALVFTNIPDPANNNFFRIRSVSSSAINIGSLGPVANGTYSIIANRGVPGAIRGDNANFAVRFPANAPPNRVMMPFLSALNPNGPFSAEFWAKPAGTNLVCPLSSVDYGYPLRSGWLFYQGSPALTDGNGFLFGIYNTTSGTSRTEAARSIPINTNAWYYVVGVFDGTNALLYVNGVNAATTALPSGQSFRPCNFSAMTFGLRSDGQYRFPSDLDEGALYTNALTAAQVAAHYQAGTNAAPAIPYQQVILNDHPAGYWRFNEQ